MRLKLAGHCLRPGLCRASLCCGPHLRMGTKPFQSLMQKATNQTDILHPKSQKIPIFAEL